MRSTSTTRSAIALVSSLALAATLSACMIQGDEHAGHESSSSQAPAEETTASEDTSTPLGKDLTKGGECAAGEDVFINGTDVDVTITGSCGEVRVEGTNITAKVSEAKSVAIRGEGNKVSGDKWDSIIIQGVGINADVKTAGPLDINGKDVSVRSDVADSILVSGEGAEVTTGDARSVDLTGANHSVSAKKISEFIVVDGTKNTVAWTEGIEKENAQHGEGNTFKRG